MDHWNDVKRSLTTRAVARHLGVDVPDAGKGKCPLCQYQKPTVTWEDEFYKCHHAGCEFKGDIFSLHEQVSGGTRLDELRELASLAGVPIQVTQLDIERSEKANQLIELVKEYLELPKPAMDYLLQRGLTKEFIQQKMIGWVPEEEMRGRSEKDIPWLLRGRILFPIWRYNMIQGVTARGINGQEPKYINNRGPLTMPINNASGPLYVVEGVVDQLLMEQHGYWCMGLIGAAREINAPRSAKQVTLLFDGDTAGNEYLSPKRALTYMPDINAELFIARLNGHKDPADYLLAGNKIEDIPKVTALELYVDGLKVEPRNAELKGITYALLRKADAITREQVFKDLAKAWKVSAAAVKADFSTSEKTHANEYVSEEGHKYLLPKGYEMNDRGLSLDGEHITWSPLFIDQVGYNRNTNEEYVRVVYYQNGILTKRTVPRTVVAKSNDLLNESAYGLPVHTGNMVGLVRFLDAWMAVNKEHIGVFHVIPQLGWHPDGFVMTDRVISGRSDLIDTRYIGDISRTAYIEQGSLDKWLMMVRKLGDLENGQLIRFMLYAGFASSVIKPLGVRPFILHVHGESSIGKTTALRLVSSIYGNPTEGQAMIRWHNTQAYLIRYMETLNNLPLVIDELSSEDRKSFDSVIYQMEGGIAKGKASRLDSQSVEKQRTFHLGVFSSGEPPILNQSSLTGATVRTWEFAGSPFGEACPDLIKAIDSVIGSNYGLVAGPYLETFIKQPKLFSMDSKFCDDDEYLVNIERRILKTLNCVFNAGSVANALFDFEFDVEEDMRWAFREIRRPVQQTGPMSDKIITHIYDFYATNKVGFGDVIKKDMGNIAEWEGSKVPNKIYGYRIGTELGIIYTEFCGMMDKFLQRNNAGVYALRRLEEAGLAKVGKPRIDRDRVRLVMFSDFFKSEELF